MKIKSPDHHTGVPPALSHHSDKHVKTIDGALCCTRLLTWIKELLHTLPRSLAHTGCQEKSGIIQQGAELPTHPDQMPARGWRSTPRSSETVILISVRLPSELKSLNPSDASWVLLVQEATFCQVVENCSDVLWLFFISCTSSWSGSRHVLCDGVVTRPLWAAIGWCQTGWTDI